MKNLHEDEKLVLHFSTGFSTGFSVLSGTIPIPLRKIAVKSQFLSVFWQNITDCITFFQRKCGKLCGKVEKKSGEAREYWFFPFFTGLRKIIFRAPKGIRNVVSPLHRPPKSSNFTSFFISLLAGQISFFQDSCPNKNLCVRARTSPVRRRRRGTRVSSLCRFSQIPSSTRSVFPGRGARSDFSKVPQQFVYPLTMGRSGFPAPHLWIMVI